MPYDALDRLLEEKTPVEQIGGTVYNSIKRTDYDPIGNITKTRVTDNQIGFPQSWACTDYEYNNRNRLEYVTQYEGANIDNITKYSYDGAGNTLTMRVGMSSKVAGGQQTNYTYDRLGHILTLTDPLNQQETYTYKNSGLGLLNTKTDRNGNVASYSYDALGRILSEQVTTPENVTETNSFTYYLTGAKKTEANPNVTTTYVYDTLARLSTETDVSGSISTVKAYTYDLANNRLSFIATVGGTQIHNTGYTYDNQNRLKTVSDKGSLKATYNYNANGARSSLVYSNGTSEHYSYNLASWLTRLENRSGNTVVSSYDYTYFADGNQRTKTDHTGRVSTYVYDGTGSLKSENESTGFGAAYTYDRFSNRATMVVTGAENYSVNYSYDANNRLTQDVKTAGSAVTTSNYFYDPNGNQLARVSETLTPAGSTTSQVGIDPSGVELYEYDGRNRQAYSNVNGEAVFYTYRADGLRDKTTKTGVMGSTVPVSETKFVWDGANIVAEMDGNNSVTTRYVRGIGLLLSDDGIGLKFYLYNGHGDVVQLADGSGNVVKAYDFDIFGNERDLDTNDTNPFRYCAEYFDANTGAYYLRARYYQPFTGRFLTEDSLAYVDPDDPLSLNLYTYCHNNPIRFIDPSGHFVSNWDRTHLIVWELKRLQYMTDNWDYVTVLQQNEWRFEAEQMRAKYRAPYEYTDSSGITWVDVAKFIEYEKNNPPVSTSNGYGNFVVAAGIAATVDGPLPFGDAIGLGILGIGTIIVYANVDNLDKTVNEVLKTKKGNIRKAPLPPGSPGWAEIGALTMEQIRRLAQQNATGFKTFWKLLHEIRFNK